MSVIDWSKKPEPWRWIGPEFVKWLERDKAKRVSPQPSDMPMKTRRRDKTPRKRWSREDLEMLFQMRSVEHKSWGDIAHTLGCTPDKAQWRYRELTRE